MPNVSKRTLETLLPPGPIWEPKQGGDFDLLLDAIAEGHEDAAEFLANLANIRNPAKTPIFEDLEREYGIEPNSNIPIADRIARLSQIVYARAKNNTPDDLQEELNRANFDLQVHLNDPPVDPAQFIDGNFNMQAGGDNAYAGYINPGGGLGAFAGIYGGEWLVNPIITNQVPAIEMQAGGDYAYAGLPNSCAGYFTSLKTWEATYSTPSQNYWPLCFFIGGEATRNAQGELTSIKTGKVLGNRKEELVTLILRIKPLMGWCGLVIEFT